MAAALDTRPRQDTDDNRRSVQRPAPVKSAGDDPIDRLPLDRWATNQLHRHGIHTIGQLVALTERDVLDVRRIGMGTLDNIVAALDTAGLTLAGGTR